MKALRAAICIFALSLFFAGLTACGGGPGGGNSNTGSNNNSPSNPSDPGTPTALTVNAPDPIFLDSDGAIFSLTITGTGFTSTDVWTISPALSAGSVSYVSSTQETATLAIDTAHYSPGWYALKACRTDNSSCATANVAFIGGQNTLTVDPLTGELYQLDQGQGVSPSSSNGYVRKFKVDGTTDGSFLYGGHAYSIAFDNGTKNLDIDGGLATPAGSFVAGMNGIDTSKHVYATAARNGVDCITQPAASVVACAPLTAGMIPATTASIANNPTSIAMATVGSDMGPVVYSMGDSKLRRYAATVAGSTVTLTPKGSVLALTDINPVSSSAEALTGGRWFVTFNSGPAAGKAAFLSRPEKVLVVIDLATMTKTAKVALGGVTGVPFRVFADEVHGKAKIAFVDSASKKTRYSEVDLVATPNEVPLNATTDALAVGSAMSPDGTKINACERSACNVFANQ